MKQASINLVDILTSMNNNMNHSVRKMKLKTIRAIYKIDSLVS